MYGLAHPVDPDHAGASLGGTLQLLVEMLYFECALRPLMAASSRSLFAEARELVLKKAQYSVQFGHPQASLRLAATASLWFSGKGGLLHWQSSRR